MKPNSVAKAARRLAAKMIADQAAEIMASLTDINGETGVTDDTVLVVVAKGRALGRLWKWLQDSSKEMMVEVERVDREPLR